MRGYPPLDPAILTSVSFSSPLLIHLIPSNLWSGRERYALDLCRYYSGEGWETVALTRDARVVDIPFEEACITVRHAPYHGFCDLSTIRRLRRLIDNCAPGRTIIIHAHRTRDALRALVARRLSGRPEVRVILTRHRVAPGKDNLLYRYIYGHLDALICVSQIARDAFLRTWHGRVAPIDENRIHVVLNSVLDAPEEALPMRERGALTGLFHGPIQPGKGLETLVQALTPVKAKGVRMRMRIMGTGHPDYVDALRRRAQQLGVMEMIDWRRHDHRPLDVVADAHFGVAPSTVPEAFCLPNAEHMACGRPVICTAMGAQPEYLEDGVSALFVAPANASALAESIIALATDPVRRAAMGIAARAAYDARLTWTEFAAIMTPILLGDRQHG